MRFLEYNADKHYRYLLFEGVRNPEDCPPHTHNRDHVTRCVAGIVEVTLQLPGEPAAVHVLNPKAEVLVPAEAMHSAVGLVEGSQMCCQFDHVDELGQPSTTLGPREAYI